MAFVKTARSANQTGLSDVIPRERYLRSRFLRLNHNDDGTGNRYEEIMDVSCYQHGSIGCDPINRDPLVPSGEQGLIVCVGGTSTEATLKICRWKRV